MPHGSQILIAAAVLFSPPAPIDAHKSGSGWTYPPACCRGNDVGGDCQRIPDRDVRKSRMGFSIVLKPGDHHLVTRTQRFLVPYGDDIPSGDGHYHACLHPSEHHLNCFFAPPDGV